MLRRIRDKYVYIDRRTNMAMQDNGNASDDSAVHTGLSHERRDLAGNIQDHAAPFQDQQRLIA
ncbi:MAG TPA: hypothetical protein VJZ71_17345 [Phycisphaerae bacterium]|nr:hypothetical protein [Phycisphaerae bacterium]